MKPLALALSLLAPSLALGQGSVGYYRFPAIHGDTIVFSGEGDLWRVGLQGGVASRLTSHPGNETQPAISPDGATLAFTGSYEGPGEVYTMPLAGGLPTRRTFDGEGSTVVGFTPEGQLLYSTRRHATLPDAQLVRLDLKTGVRELLPLAQASDGTFDDSGTLFFTRLAFQGSHTKRYRGGTAQNVWKLAPGGAEALPLTADFLGTSKEPMVWEGRVYFVSDRDGTMNLWSMDGEGRELRQHTHHVGWDVAAPSLDDGRIAYQLGADLRLFDARTGTDKPVPIQLASDFDQMREAWIKKPMDYLTAAALSPKGDRVALTARGQVFVAPVKQGRLVEATRRPRVRYRKATFLDDGTIVALSDESGEVEIWRLPANGVGAGDRLTKDGTVLRWEAVPSPDGKWIAHHDKDRRLWLLSVEKKASTLVASSTAGDFRDLAWSADSRWLAYVGPATNGFDRIHLVNVEARTPQAVTSDRFDSWSPVFSADGEWLYFLSDRNLKSLVPSPWGPRQPDPFLASPTEIYALALKKGLRSPFDPLDELHPEKPKEEEKAKGNEKDGKAQDKAKAKADEAKVKPVAIDVDGLAERLVKVPVPAGRYESLFTDGQRLFFLSVDSSFEGKKALKALAIGREKPNVKTVLEDVKDTSLSGDRKKLLVRKGDDLYVFDAADKAPEKLDETKVDLGRWTFSFDPREEWRQMFVEAWRLERDYFYDPSLHSVDWKKVLAKYEPLVDRVTTRAELSDLMAQMVSELSALHTFVYGGDVRKGSDEVEVGSLGADFVRDPGAGGYRVSRIYRSDPDLPGELSPLRALAVGVKEGDVIEAINGVATLAVPDVSVLLRSQTGRQVLLRVKPQAGGAARDVIAVPLSPRDGASLRYTDWEYARRLRVEAEGKGRLGYVHLRAMGRDNYTEWARDFYPAFDRQGLIVDVRHNRGGNIDSWILGKLLRKAWFYWKPRVGDPYWNMHYAFRGHVAVLIDQHTASDGEAFAEGARRLGIGKLIGMRTWGGEIWLTSSNVLVDKGIATAAEFGVYGPEGEWLIEGHGVEPDTVVDNLPKATFGGQDAQLDAAIRYLLDKIEKEPVKVPGAPPYPKK